MSVGIVLMRDDGTEFRLAFRGGSLLLLTSGRFPRQESAKVRTAIGEFVLTDDRLYVFGETFEVADRDQSDEFVKAMQAHIDRPSGTPGNDLPFELTDHSSDAFFEEFSEVGERWQYATINTGMFNTGERLAKMLGLAGEAGWELVGIYDKSSNWFAGMEKGFMAFRRRVPAGVEPKSWSIQFNATYMSTEGPSSKHKIGR
jgi:hypothetical protein